MKKNLLIALAAFLTIGITTANASKTIEFKTNKTNNKFESKKYLNICFNPILLAASSTSETCADGSVYVTLALLWLNDDGSTSMQFVHYGQECPLTPPPSQP